MFTQGQWIFAGIFLVAFVIAAIYVYRKDIGQHNLHYKGAYRVLIAFLVFIAFLFFVKTFLRH